MSRHGIPKKVPAHQLGSPCTPLPMLQSKPTIRQRHIRIRIPGKIPNRPQLPRPRRRIRHDITTSRHKRILFELGNLSPILMLVLVPNRSIGFVARLRFEVGFRWEELRFRCVRVWGDAGFGLGVEARGCESRARQGRNYQERQKWFHYLTMHCREVTK